MLKLNYLNKKKIVKLINEGRCIFTPTDTVCGLMCNNAQNIYQLKKRSLNKHIILFISHYNTIPNLSNIQIEFLKKIWPGKTTIIKDNVAYRIPHVKPLISILKKTGPIYCSSANISGQETINNFKKAFLIFGEKIAYITNTFKGSSVPSTIIDIDKWKILREGQDLEWIKSFLNKNILDKNNII